MRPLQYISRLIAPPACVGCGKEGMVLCRPCADSLEPPPAAICFWCSRPSPQGLTCARCRRLTALTGVKVAAHYGGVTRQLIHRLKYQRLRDAATPLAVSLTPLFRDVGPSFEVVTSVPVATTRLRQRGYNQSELIARQVARGLGLPYRPLLRRQHNTQQVGKTRSERLVNVKDVFIAAGPLPARILIIDDVLTTGATVNACAIALQAAGATEVWGAAAARD